MNLDSIGHGTWRCEPALAAFLVSRVVWAADGELLIETSNATAQSRSAFR